MSEKAKSNLHVYEAIAAVTAEMSKEGIGKDRKNQQQGYQFRGIDDVYNALSPVLAKNKLCIIPRMIERDLVERVSQRGGVLFYVTVKTEFDFVSAVDGSQHTVVTYGEAMDSGDKATNKAMSAAYKYAAFQTFCIPTEGDNDADATTHEVAPKAKPKDKAWSAKSAANAREDQKPATPMPDEEYDKYRIAISEAADLDNLKAAFTEACDKARGYGDGPATNGLIKLKDIRKKELEAQ